ncbi:hypothetical protein [Seonamhaeicola marinus]|uniref:Uncharacterized protein n=1 Tax=Seonamhaeicola marinus TaxID=1912246 RepID=A0A5D0HZL5_9FLAO|nr:hypothetical protein [Seonamhaeicola marinus]TYA74952.1 hypothetical protein FUA24_16770 [Seonamhaeicola marinus]
MSEVDWMNEEENKADDLNKEGVVPNGKAPVMVKVYREPPRQQRPISIQDKHWFTLQELVSKQKKNGVRSTHLYEEAIELLLEKYGMKVLN